MDIETKLDAMNLTLPTAPKPVASYVPAVRSGDLVFVSGQLPFAGDELLAHGPVPRHTSVEDAQACARRCVLNGLAVVKDAIGGDFSKLVRVVRVGAFVASDSNFVDQPKIINGASDLLEQLMGEAGRHARAAVGVNVLPLNAPVEIEFVFQVRD